MKINTPLYIVLSVTAFLIIVSNIFTIIILATTKHLRNVTGYLMISLAVADLGVGITTSILLFYTLFTDDLTQITCDWTGFVSSVSWVVSVYTLMLLSLDRYLAITKPLHYHIIVTPFRCYIAITLTWLMSSFLWILPVIGVGGYTFNAEEAECYFNIEAHPAQWIAYMVIIFVPTSGTIIFCYSAIWKISIHRQPLSHIILNQQNLHQDYINYRALKTLSIIVGAFYIAWTPYIVEHLVKAFKGTLEHVPEVLEISIFVLAVTNSFWNPIIYIGMNRRFRKVLSDICCCCVGRTEH